MGRNIDKKNLESCSECACFNLKKASRTITQLFDRAMQPSGLRGTQFSILTMLSFMGPSKVTRLSKNLIMDRTTLTRNLRPLEKQGFIKVTAGADLRTRSVELTNNGVRALRKAFPLWKETQIKIINKLGKKSFKSLINDLSKISSLFSVNDRN
jgi:DNA-binding MarR family transcriptional regulator